MADYATIAEVRGEGLTVADANDARIASLVTEASLLVDHLTGQWFSAETITLTLDGPGDARLIGISGSHPRSVSFTRTTQPEFSRGSVLHLPLPVIAVTELRRVFPGTTAPDVVVDADDYIVYNRTFPIDDRHNPKFVHRTGSFERGHQIYEIDGLFGYVENPGAIDIGVTNLVPPGIRRATIMLVARWALGVGDPDSFLERRRSDLVGITVQGRSARWGSSGDAGTGGSWTGDAEIDKILVRFRRPIHVRAI